MKITQAIALPSVQLLPVHPLVQLHLYEPMVFTQEALFPHGEILHSFMSETRHGSHSPN
jgi:hypothetical protein